MYIACWLAGTENGDGTFTSLDGGVEILDGFSSMMFLTYGVRMGMATMEDAWITRPNDDAMVTATELGMTMARHAASSGGDA